LRGRGRPPKPAALRILEGNRGHRPIPETVKVESDLLPTPPEFLHAYALEEWNRLANQLYLIGVLTEIDEKTFAAYCQAFARWRVCEERLKLDAAADPAYGGIMLKTKSGNYIQNPMLSAANAAYRDMCKLAALFGLTPSARSQIKKKDGSNESDRMARKYGLA
jgi:P27 family predicted phage terminase small subunit